MPKYRKITPIEAEPYQKGLENGFDEYNSKTRLIPGELFDIALRWVLCADNGEWECKIPYMNTKENQRLYIMPDDYIITNLTGERYPCKKDIFEQTYELIS